jgi:hypothetical protein
VECKFSSEPGIPVIPISFIWEDGRKFDVKVLSWRKAASQAVGGAGYRYECKVMNKIVFMYLEEDKWFMEAKR